MNATGITQKSVRLSRIQKISGILRFCVLVYFLLIFGLVIINSKNLHLTNGTISIFDHAYASATDIPAAMIVLCAIGSGIYIFGVICFYRLLCLYAKGVIFSAANVLQIKRLGGCMVGYGLVGFAASILYLDGALTMWTPLELVSSPWFVVGGAIYLVAWIMDEGRKIQEEQELTV